MAACPPETSYVLWALTSVWKRGGWIGVDLFFVLSGFLVSGLLFREYQKRRSVNIGRFLIRRGFKIYPAFWVLLAVTVVVRLALDGRLSTSALLGELLFVQNYADSFWGHTWSLAVEEHFYLLLALLTVWLCHQRAATSNPFAALPSIFVAVASVCLALRVRVGMTLPYNNYTHLFATHIRIDALLFGVLLSYYWHFERLSENARLSRHAKLLGLLGGLALAPAFIFPLERTTWIPTFGLTCFYVGSGAILLSMLYVEIPESRLTRSLANVGMFSYSIYLWHLPVEHWSGAIVERLLGIESNWFVYVAMYLIGAVGIGILAAKAVEYPVLRLRDRLYPSRTPSRSPAAVPNLSMPYATQRRS